MAVKKIIQIGNPKLVAENLRVDNVDLPKIRQIIKDLTDTMREKGLVGIAAPQIGENYKILITEPRKTEARTGDQTDELRVFINPEITYFSNDKVIIFEGCGSVENSQVFSPVERPKIIIVEAIDEKGKRFKIKCDGLLARVIQHEFDHLNGIQFIDRVEDKSKIVSREVYFEKYRNLVDQAIVTRINIKEITFI